MFGPDVKKKVILKWHELFGPDGRITVTGQRDAVADVYNVTLLYDDEPIARASNRDWRRAYKRLVLEVEKMYADGYVYVPPVGKTFV